MKKSQTSTKITLTIGEAAELLEISPATLRNWEKYGLFTASRAKNGYRCFSFSDIEFLKRIRRYMIDDNGRTRAMRKVNAIMEEQSDAYLQKLSKDIYGDDNEVFHYSGSRWKEARIARKITLQELSKLTGISVSYLSKVENDKAIPSFETLNRLASFYGESLVHFTEEGSVSDFSLVRKKEAVCLNLGYSNLKTYRISNMRDCKMFPVIHSLSPNGSSGESHSHNGEELVYVLEGKLTVELNNSDVYVLLPGDTMTFKASTPHRYMNYSTKQAIVLWVHTS